MADNKKSDFSQIFHDFPKHICLPAVQCWLLGRIKAIERGQNALVLSSSCLIHDLRWNRNPRKCVA